MKKYIILTSLLALVACGGGSGGGHSGGISTNGNGDITNNDGDINDNTGGNNNENTGGENNSAGDNNNENNNTGNNNTNDDNNNGNNNENNGDTPDLPEIIVPELFSGDLHMIPQQTHGGEGPTETYHLIANSETGDIVMRTYISECDDCESDSRGFIKNDFIIANVNDFTNGIHSNGLTAFLNQADNIGMQYSDIFTSFDPMFEDTAIEPMYYDSKVVDMDNLANSLTDDIEYQGKAYGLFSVKNGENTTHNLMDINKQGNPIGADATLIFDPNNGTPKETLTANFSAFDWYDTTITMEGGNITDVQLTQNGTIASGFEVDNGGADNIQETRANTIYSGADSNAAATEAVGKYRVEWQNNGTEKKLDITFGGVKQ